MLLELRNKARNENCYTSGLLLATLLKKLETEFKQKWDSIKAKDRHYYFENLGCEVRETDSACFLGDENYVPIRFRMPRMGSIYPPTTFYVNIKIPTELADKVLVLGF